MTEPTDDMFKEENDLLKSSLQVLERKQVDSELNNSFMQLALGYRKLIRQMRKIVKISDKQQKLLSDRNEQLNILTKELHIKNKEITKSITYARRIQNSVLPSKKIIKDCFSDYFVLFKPQAVLSGDFYWFSKFENRVIVAVADCTDHGIPGALMSMLGLSFLNEILNNTTIAGVHNVLNALRNYVINAMDQNGEVGEHKEGMDMSICEINTDTKECVFAGANNSMYIIRVNNKPLIINDEVAEPIEVIHDTMGTKYLYEIHPDKMPISIFKIMDPFTYKKIKLLEGDLLYMFTDGFADQFGGRDNKKFMVSRFRKLLLSVTDVDLDYQRYTLDKTINEWMLYSDPNTDKPNVQTDDILVVGLKI